VPASLVSSVLQLGKASLTVAARFQRARGKYDTWTAKCAKTIGFD